MSVTRSSTPNPSQIRRLFHEEDELPDAPAAYTEEGKSFEEKLTAVQTLREQYIELFNKQNEYAESRKRLRRVYRIIK